ncbi:hypothetical protein L1887_03532 [Cichorium endivia]|nr:hypothetical protein L1887_03532 [Cichorium endivia]
MREQEEMRCKRENRRKERAIPEIDPTKTIRSTVARNVRTTAEKRIINIEAFAHGVYTNQEAKSIVCRKLIKVYSSRVRYM